MKKNYVIDARTLSGIAADYAGINVNDIFAVSVEYAEGDIYEVEFRTDWIKYDCYVDVMTNEVIGFMTEPMPISEVSDVIRYTASGAISVMRPAV